MLARVGFVWFVHSEVGVIVNDDSCTFAMLQPELDGGLALVAANTAMRDFCIGTEVMLDYSWI